MYIRIFILTLFIIICQQFSVAQTSLGEGQGYLVNAKIVDGDTLPHISLRQVIIIPPRTFKNERDRRRYRKLIRNLKKTLPYSRMAGEVFREINDELPKFTSDRERKKYVNKMDKKLKKQFEGELRNLTISQGRLLIKLIDRETDNTTFQVIKQLKGSFSAFMWQSVARIFGSNLKSEYDAAFEDKYIEEIIIQIDNGQL